MTKAARRRDYSENESSCASAQDRSSTGEALPLLSSFGHPGWATIPAASPESSQPLHGTAGVILGYFTSISPSDRHTNAEMHPLAWHKLLNLILRVHLELSEPAAPVQVSSRSASYGSLS